MNSSALCALLLTLCVILISHSPVPANARVPGHHGLLGQICSETLQDKFNCMTMLKAADPKILRAKNFLELSTAILDLALNKGVEGQKFLKGLAQVNNAPAIVQCANFHYDGVVGSFRSSLGELKDDPQTANYDAKVASDGSEGCERALANEKIVNPAISALNHEITLLSNIAFLATSKLAM